MGPPPGRPRPRGPQTTTSGKALAALLLGIGTFIIPVLMAIPAVILGILALKDIARAGGRLTGKGMAMAGLACALVGNVTLLAYLWVYDTVGERRDRNLSQNNLKQIALAFHNYHDSYKRFPASQNRVGGGFGGPQGGPPHSWRVAILPYIEEEVLFRQYRLNEPWDSPHNLSLLPRMPKIYAPVRGTTTQPHSTFYQVFTGQKTPFKGPIPPRIVMFADGTSNTFLVAEAGEAVPWTRPDDMAVPDFGSLPPLGGMFGGNFNVALADGSVFWVDRHRVSEPTLRLLIDPQDGNVIPEDWNR
jgi:hypothetical protein